jgi:NADH-quinone oxidoreductase subunit M
MLTFTIFAPLATGVLILLMPSRRWRAIRIVTVAGAVVTLMASLAIAAGISSEATLSFRQVVPWIPTIGASYDVGVDGLSVPLIVLTAVLLCTVAVYAIGNADRAKGHAFLFLLMSTGLIGVFASQDLLLFYVFFEVALVPMYFIIGVWGHEQRRYAAMKFFLYTRAGSLGMLLSFLALSLAAHSFSIETLARVRPFGASPAAGALALLGLLLGFGVKLPTVPLHNWLPDAHVEAPTEGSVMLAGIQLKMGGYGLLRVALPLLPDALRTWAWVALVLGLVSMIYGALAALAQRDFKRMVAYTSINHMGYVMVAVAVAAVTVDSSVRQLALAGAVFQMVSHGLLTGGMFFLAGMLQDGTGTRDMMRVGGLFRTMPRWSALLVVLAFGSLGLPGLSGFAAEFQVIGAALSVHWWVAAIIVVGLAITTGLYIRAISLLAMGESKGGESAADPTVRKIGVVAALAVLSLILGLLPSLITSRVVGPAPQSERGR